MSYVLAVAAPLFTAVLREAASALIGDRAPMRLLMLPVVVMAWLGGLGPGLVATAVSLGLSDYVLLGLANGFAMPSRAEATRLGLFAFSGVVISLLGEAARRASRRTQQDLAERKRAEQALRQSENRFRALFESSPDAVFFTVADGRILGANPAACALFGASEEAICRGGRESLVDTTDPRYAALLEGRRRTKRILNAELRCRRVGNGEVFTGEVNSVILSDGEHAFVTVRDISARKQAEEALRESEEKYCTLFHSIDAAFCIMRVSFDERGKPQDYCVVQANPAFEQHTGLANAAGKSIRELVGYVEEHWFERFGQIVVTGVPARFQAHSEGLGRTFDAYAFRLGRPSEQKVAVLFHDITERDRAAKERERIVWELQETQMALCQAKEELTQANAQLEVLVQQRTAQLRAANQLLREESEQRQRNVVALTQSEERYRRLVEVLPEAVCVTRGDRIVFINAAGLALFGATESSQLLGKALADLFRPRRRRQQFAADSVPFPFDGEIFRLDGGARYVEGTVCSGQDATGAFLQMILRDITERKLVEQEILTAVEEERQRLGRELHDGLGQMLTGAKFKIGLLERKLNRNMVIAPAEILALEQDVNEAIAQTRAVAYGLNPVKLVAQGLASALDELAQSIRAASGLECVCASAEAVTIADHGIAQHLFRIAQEAAHNAVKHAKARSIRIQLGEHPGGIALSIEDDGIGFRESGKGEGAGMGLFNMRARAELIGAAFSIQSSLGCGTTVSCTWTKDQRQ